MRLQALTADKNVDYSIVNQVILPTQGAELPVKDGWPATTLRRLVVLNPVGLATDFVQSPLPYLGQTQDRLQLPSKRGRARHQARLGEFVWKRPSIWNLWHTGLVQLDDRR